MKWRYAVAAALGILLVAVIGIGWLVAANADRVIGMTFVGPIDASGLDDPELAAALTDFEEELADRERTLSIDGTVVSVLGSSLGLNVDVDATSTEVMAVGRGGLWETINTTVFRPPAKILPRLRIDDTNLAASVDFWNESVIENQPFDGAFVFEDGEVRLLPPTAGVAVNESGLAGALIGAFLDPPEDVTVLETTVRPSAVTAETAAAGLSEAEALVAKSIKLGSTDPDVEVSFSSDELGEALIWTVEGSGIHPDLDPAVIQRYLEPVQAQLEAPPRDAEITITDDDVVMIVPGKPGGLIDPSLVVDSLTAAAGRPDRTGTLVYVEGSDPMFTTEDALALGIKEKVSEFTTEHSCCQPRVENIHQIADIVDGAIVMPGEEFNVNEYVGPRTPEKGFVAAPMILAGRFVDSVGGGISQFATTLYNAVFFGGYTDVTHTPHSYYFSRYPEGREATVSFPLPDLIFRNDTDAALLIKTEHTDTSITVKFFGDNGGIQVEADSSERTRYRNPITEYQPDASLEPGAERVVSSGSSGWDITVTRTITKPNGEVVTETWDERYRPQFRIVRRHPCSIPGAVEACPTTTTTSSTTLAPVPPDTAVPTTTG